MQTADKKRILLLAAALTAVTLSSCSDISRPTVNAYTADTALTEPEEDEEYEEPPEDDDDGDVELILPENFVTTGDEPAPVTSAQTTTAKSSTTFPIQTTSFEPLVISETTTVPTAETTAATTTTEATTTTAETTTAAATVSETAVQTVVEQTQIVAESAPISYNVIGDNGILVSYQDGHYRGIMACFGTYGLCERWAAAVNAFAANLPDAKVYTMAVPIASEFYTPQKFWDQGFTVSQYNKCEHIRQNLSGATYIDAYTSLSQHTGENISSRTDHHWTPLGAYYAAEQFAAAAGVDFPSIEEYTPVSRSGYVGSMYTYSKDYHLYNDAETFTMYLSPNADRISTTYYNTYFGGAYAGDLFVTRNASAFYCSFLGSDDRITHVHTDVGNGRTLVVFKQSYGNALIPFLTSGFEDIYVCDMRYFELNGIKFCKDVGATDVLCTDCVMIAAGNGCKYLEYILNR